MSTHISGKPVKSKRVRSGGGVRRERQEERGEKVVREVYINEGAASLRGHGSGSQGATGEQDSPVVQRELILQRELNLQRDLNLHRELTIQRDIVRTCAVILTLLFAIFVTRTVDMAMDYRSALKQLQPNCDNLTMQRNQCHPIYTKSCPSGWQTFGCSCYYRSTEKKTWEESRELCLKTGADLVVINSEEELKFIRGLDGVNLHWNGASWIGLNRSEGAWTWVDGTALTTGYSGVPYTERADNNHNCAEYWHKKGTWSNLLCSYNRASICEK